MTVPEEWVPGLLLGRVGSQTKGDVELSALVQIRRAHTGSCPALFIANDLARYWCKWPGNPHGDQSLLHELVVARLGGLLGAPMPRAVIIEVAPYLAGGIAAPDGTSAQGGTWFGLEMVDGTEYQAVQGRYRGKENQRRLARYLAVWDLCLGGDAQFMYEPTPGHVMWSIDHGLWFDGVEGPWDRDTLPVLKDQSWDDPPWSGSFRIDPAELIEAADRVEDITVSDLIRILEEVPIAWGISPEDLDALGNLIFDRRTLVADRLRSRSAGQTRIART